MRPGGIRFLLAFVLTVAAVLGSLAAFLAVLDSTGRLRAPMISSRKEFGERLHYLREAGSVRSTRS